MENEAEEVAMPGDLLSRPLIEIAADLRASLGSPIRPAVSRFSPAKSLNAKGCCGPGGGKSAVVPTKSILKAANVPIIGGHHVLALQGSPEGWQATPLLERC